MQVFAVIKVTAPSLVKAKIAERYADNYYEVDEETLFVAAQGETTRQVATNIGLGEGDPEDLSSGIVIPVTSYWGRYNPELWEWINVKQRSNVG